VTTQGVKRKLTAILNADVVWYSRLMGEDDAATVRTLGEYREVIANYIIQYRGRVVDSPGDNLLSEFASVVDAVQCAAEIQRELAERNSEIPEDRRMQYRIGVNLGDVYPNLYVVDWSVIPTAVGVSPATTIAAITEKVSEYIKGNL
jgi:adenylate cyclase